MNVETQFQFEAAVKASAVAHGYGGDPDLLVERYKPLVRKIAWHVHGRAARTSQLDDLVQVGFIALIEASRSYEERGFAFSTYASMRIRGSMIDHLRSTMAAGRNAAASARRLDMAQQKLWQMLGRNPSSQELASHLGIEPGALFALQQLAATGQVMALDDLGDDSHALIDECQLDQSERAEQADLLENLSVLVAALPTREQMVLQLYFFEELNLHEIGAVMGVSAARVCQIKSRALADLKIAMRARTE